MNRIEHIRELYQVFESHPGICTDTRKLEPGSLFFALKGAHFDGNRFARHALENGAAYAVTDDPEAAGEGSRGGHPHAERYLLVDDVLSSLQELARFHRRRMNIPVIALTGSNGKTTTKELISRCLSTSYEVLATRGNLNNHIGVPLTLLQLRPGHELAVVEMGANHPDEISFLCSIAEPDSGLITNIGRAHLEGFGSLEGVKKAKGELYDYLGSQGKPVYVNLEDGVLTAMAESSGALPIGYGRGKGTLVSGRVTGNDPFLSVELSFPDSGACPVATKLTGSYNLANLLAAACVARYFRVESPVICEALAGYEPGNMRSQLIRTERNTVLLDTYNANPSSVAAALQNLKHLEAERKTVILGEMKELGPQSSQLHQKVVKLLADLGVEEAFLVGEAFKAFPVPEKYRCFVQTSELKDYLERHRISDSCILIKGSRLMELEQIVPLL